MPSIRKPAVDPLRAALAPETIDVLLFGWAAPTMDYATDPRSDPFECFSIDLDAAWRQHRAALLAEWARRGEVGQPKWAPADDGARG